jgi:hypothetical protein
MDFRLLLFSLLALSLNSAASAQVWATAVSRHAVEDRAIVFRFIKEFAKGFDQKQQPDRIIIVWQYKSDKGMPTVPERTLMDTLEDTLKPYVEDAGFSTLALVSTGENRREWIYYTKSEKEFFSRLNRALKNSPVFPIEIHAAPDPQWTSYGNFRAGIRE